MSTPLVMQVSDFVALCNQTLDYAYPSVIIEGEVSNFRVARGKWVYFDIKDDLASLKCFGTIYQLPGPLEDGMRVRIYGAPKLHPLYNFSITLSRIEPAGEGALKKAFELLKAKLQKEGMFAEERKRRLPAFPESIGIVASTESAAYGDFVKVITARWPLARLYVCNVQVQGEAAPADIVAGIAALNQQVPQCDALVVTRGGGSAEDLAAFNDERVVRSIVGSRIPTVVAIGHERDVSLAELAADCRASTPSNAAELIAPEAASQAAWLAQAQVRLQAGLVSISKQEVVRIEHMREQLQQALSHMIKEEQQRILVWRQLLAAYNPDAALQRGYALVRTDQGQAVAGIGQVRTGAMLGVRLQDGSFEALVQKVTPIKAHQKTK